MRKLLVVVDYQKDFVDGSLGFAGAELLDSKIVKRIKEYLANGDMVMFTMDTHFKKDLNPKFKDYLETREGKQLPVYHCVHGTPGWELYGDTGKLLKDGVNSIMLKKYTFGINPKDMCSEIFDEDFCEIELVGLVTNMCVISNAVTMQARYPDAQIRVSRKLCDSFDKKMHDAALDVLASMQVEVGDWE